MDKEKLDRIESVLEYVAMGKGDLMDIWKSIRKELEGALKPSNNNSAVVWIKFSDKKPPVGDCQTNLLLLWKKCPDGIRYPEYWMGYEMGFFDGVIFFDNNYRYRIDNVEYWSVLQTRPTTEDMENVERQKPITGAPSTLVCPYCYGRGLQNTGCTEFTTEPCFTCKGVGKLACA